MTQNKLPTIPEYFKAHVDNKIDLNKERAIPCPFHNETHGKSFTYSKEKKIFRCWGACHTGGDVIALHMLNMHLKSRDEAKRSLYKLYDIDDKPTFERQTHEINEDFVKDRRLISEALALGYDKQLIRLLNDDLSSTSKLEVYVNSKRRMQ